MEFYITKREEGQKCHRFVRKLIPGAPTSFIYRMFRLKDVKVNGKNVSKDYILSQGDQLSLYLTDEYYEKWKKESPPMVKGLLHVVYEDEDYLVVYKLQEEGVLPIKGKISLTDKVQWYLRDFQTPTFTPSPLHRLDTNTEGLVAFGKSYVASRRFTEALQKGEVLRKYLAVVEGVLEENKTVTVFLEKSEGKMVVSENGVLASSIVKPLIHHHNRTLVEVELLTGRTHQIRATMEHLGHPLIGDVKYGSGGKGQWLCSYILEFGTVKIRCIHSHFRRKLQEEFHEYTAQANTHSIRRLQL